MPRDAAAFHAWRDDADAADLLEMAKRLGAKLTQPYRGSREWIGPCPSCGGVDRFSLNTGKNRWNCRSGGGGSGAIDMVMHAGQMSFLEACEWITGRPNPNGREAKPLSAEQRAEIEQRRAVAEASQRAREAELAAHEENTREAAAGIWNASVGLVGTLGEVHLRRRGIDMATWPDVLRFNPNCPLGEWSTAPAVVARVDDLDGSLCAVWRIFLKPDGSNMLNRDGDKMKLGVGPAGGGAVRLGGVAPKIGAAEGVETALGAALLTGCQYPVWSTLSTAGMTALEVPLRVDHVVIFPDGDRPIRKKNGIYLPDVPPGRRSAVALRDRLLSESVGVTLAAEPSPGCDYLDLWNCAREEVA